MKKLLVILFSLLISFDSYGGWFDKTVCIENDFDLFVHTSSYNRSLTESVAVHNFRRIWGDLSTIWGTNFFGNPTPFTGKNLCKYGDQIMSKGKIIDGKFEGKWNFWDVNGQIVKEGNFKHGTGKFTEWCENGKIKSEVYYENGLLIRGTEYSYYERRKNGHKNFSGKCDFPNRVENYKSRWHTTDGIQLHWYSNGQKRYEKNYKDGKLDGKYTFWKENGQIKSVKYYKDDECISGC